MKKNRPLSECNCKKDHTLLISWKLWNKLKKYGYVSNPFCKYSDVYKIVFWCPLFKIVK
jgi:hypothetical protein